ncbi:hypothetical protein KFE25_014049 [Diacronema lutheri]|uniref:D-xylose 1-dehydrogenase (NADP(+), D-xylono-1,5-lactone-forming) n=1 Tax=Diacronema lutheri TaxID=2081491 RepID=A0A8J5XFM3_DIALT|nr:hypothetical protein KFE25_014049 [Diacronema lutheri]
MEPLDKRKLRWGILGTGRIAKDFCAAIVAAGDTNEIAMVAGRRPNAAKEMAETYGGRPSTVEGGGAYEQLERADDVDVVYVAVVHKFHKEHILRSLVCGKHVLCEKPMCLNAAETRAVVAAARVAGRLLVEGHWTQCWPAAREARTLIRNGAIGELVAIASDFSYPNKIDASNTECQNEVGGGATMFVGPYPLCAALRSLGKPEEVHAVGSLAKPTPAGVIDTAAAVTMRFAGGRLAVATYGWASEGAQQTTMMGTHGKITLPQPAQAPTVLKLTAKKDGQDEPTEEVREFPLPKHPPGLPPLLYPNAEGQVYQVRAVEEAIRRGETECEHMPLDASMHLAETMDNVRAQLGVAFAKDGLRARLAARLAPSRRALAPACLTFGAICAVSLTSALAGAFLTAATARGAPV